MGEASVATTMEARTVASRWACSVLPFSKVSVTVAVVCEIAEIGAAMSKRPAPALTMRLPKLLF